MANDVFRCETHDGNATHVFKHIASVCETAFDSFRQVHLCRIPRDNSTRSKADTRQEHLHLLGRCVLGFIQNHKSIVERTPAHEGKRRNLNDLFFNQPLRLFKPEEIK